MLRSISRCATGLKLEATQGISCVPHGTRNFAIATARLPFVACSHALTLIDKSMPACGQLLDVPWKPRM